MEEQSPRANMKPRDKAHRSSIMRPPKAQFIQRKAKPKDDSGVHLSSSSVEILNTIPQQIEIVYMSNHQPPSRIFTHRKMSQEQK
jgi:hypothetical protein